METLLRTLLGRTPTQLERNINFAHWGANPLIYEALIAKNNKNK